MTVKLRLIRLHQSDIVGESNSTLANSVGVWRWHVSITSFSLLFLSSQCPESEPFCRFPCLVGFDWCLFTLPCFLEVSFLGLSICQVACASPHQLVSLYCGLAFWLYLIRWAVVLFFLSLPLPSWSLPILCWTCYLSCWQVLNRLNSSGYIYPEVRLWTTIALLSSWCLHALYFLRALLVCRAIVPAAIPDPQM